MNRRLSLLLVVSVALWAMVIFQVGYAFGYATPRPAAPVQVPVSPGQQVAPATEQRTGAPQPVEPTVGSTLGVVAEPTTGDPGGALTPRPSGGIGQPASYCKPGYCEEPPSNPSTKSVGRSSITGTATYYCRPGISRCTRGYPFGMYAAAGPELRAMLGDWRGRTVVVIDANGRGVLVQLIDWCACGGDHVIDLYWTAYQGLVNPVTVREQP